MQHSDGNLSVIRKTTDKQALKNKKIRDKMLQDKEIKTHLQP